MTTQRTIWQVGNFRPAHSTENHLRRALESLGHDVVPLQEDDRASWDRLVHDAVNDRPDLVLWTRTWHLPDFPQMEALARLHEAGVPTVAYHLDRWWGLPREHQVLDEPFFRCDVVVTADGGHDDHWRSAGVRHVWFPPAVLGSEARATTGPDRPPLSARRDFAVDVAFVGSWSNYHPEWPWRRELIAKLRSTYGHRCGVFPRTGTPSIRGQALADLYATAKVIVGDSCLAGDAGFYWSDRIPETLGRRGFLIHPYVDGIEDHYTDGEHLVLVPAESWSALRHAIDNALRDPDGRAEIAAAGQAHVLAHHTYEVRMADLIDWLEVEGLLPSVRDRTGPTVVRSGALTATFDLRANRSDGVVVAETWGENVYGLDPAEVAGKVCLDLGANIGAWTVWAARSGAATIVASEPLDANRERLNRNLRLNDLAATVTAVGVAGAPGTVKIGWNPDDPASASTAHNPGGYSAADVKVETLAHFVALAGGQVEVMKIDVEGAEYPALIRACEEGSLQYVDRIVGEWHPPPDLVTFGDWCASLLGWGELRILGNPDAGGQFAWRRYGA